MTGSLGRQALEFAQITTDVSLVTKEPIPMTVLTVQAVY